MSKKRTILVSGVSGIVGYGIVKALKSYDKDINIIATTIYDESAANFVGDVFIKAPITSDEKYFYWLIEVIKKHDVDMIIPSIEIDMFAWNENRNLFEDLKCHVLLNNEKLIELSKDKWLFYEELVKNNSPYAIDSYIEPVILGYPFLLKPRRGYGSQGIVKVENREIFDQHKAEIGKKLMVQPLIGNDEEEYTISAFFDKKSELKAYMQLKRKLSKQGFTEIAETVEVKGIKEALLSLAKIFKPFGPTNFQFRVQEKQLKLLEINPRISSATSIRTSFGYNESKMSIEYFLDNKEIKQPQLKTGKAIRYTEDLIQYDSANI